MEYDEDYNYIGASFNSTLPTQGLYTTTTQSNAKYLRVSFYESRFDTLQIELGSTQTLYEQYIGYTIFALESGEKVSFAENFSKISKKWFGKNWLAIGDSITFRDTYPPYVRDILKLGSYTNKGVSGRYLRTMVYDTDGVTLLDSTALADFDLITIMDLVNDYGTDRPLGSMGDVEATGTFYGDLHKVISHFCTEAPNKKIVFISELNFAGYGYTWHQANGAGVTQAQYNEAMKLSCEKYGIPFIDLLALGGANEFNYASFYDGSDYIHPGANSGMINIAKIISNNLEIV